MLTLLVLVLLAAAGCRTEPPNLGVSATTIADDPETYYDQVVTVSGEVDDVYGPQVFSIGGDDFDNQMLVISETPIAVVPGRTAENPVAENDVVQVTGIVKPMVIADLKADYDIDLDPDLEVEFENQPVLIASSSAAVMAGVVVTPRTATMSQGPVVELSTLTESDDPGRFAGRQATFMNARVLKKLGTYSFWIGTDTTAQLLVVVNDMAVPDTASIRAGSQWFLSGILRPLPEASTLEVEWDLKQDAIDQMAGERVYLDAIRAQPTGTENS